LRSLALTLSLLTQFVERWAPAAVDHPTCNGGPSAAPWSKQTCGQYVRSWQRADDTTAYSSLQLCTTCERRKQLHEASMRSAVA